MCDVQKSYLAARANGIKVQDDPTPLLMVYEMPRFLEEYRSQQREHAKENAQGAMRWSGHSSSSRCQ
jgi:hypothetical protein